MAEYLLPDVGEGLTEAEIVAWKVKVGDVVAVNDIVVEIETAKSLVELPSPYAGTVMAVLVQEGETVPVGTPIIAIGDPADPPAGSAGPDKSAEQASTQQAPAGSGAEIDLSNPAASGSGEGESLVGRMKAERGAVRRTRRAAPGGGAAGTGSAAASATQQQLQGSFQPGLPSPDVVEAGEEEAVPATPARSQASSDASTGQVRALAKPPVRKLAKDLGVDLGSITPTGPDGTVTRADVQAAAGVSGEAADELGSRALAAEGIVGGFQVAGGERERSEPVKGVRKMMAGAMVQSAFTAPHVTEWVTIDATRTMELVERLRQRREFRDVRVSPLLVLARAVLLAMRRTPEINSFWDEPGQQVVFKNYVNLGIAAATPRGLVVPNVKDADRLSLVELAGALNELTSIARDGRTQPADMSGGTFTITNVGVFGVDAGTPIINPGESAILCFGAVRKQPWVVGTEDGDAITIRHVTTLALSFDHRHIDGEKGSRFLADVAGILEDPATALLF